MVRETSMQKFEMKEQPVTWFADPERPRNPRIIDPDVIDRVVRLIYLWHDPRAPDSMPKGTFRRDNFVSA